MKLYDIRDLPVRAAAPAAHLIAAFMVAAAPNPLRPFAVASNTPASGTSSTRTTVRRWFVTCGT